MCDRFNSLVCNDRSNSHWRLGHSGVIVNELNAATYPRFASFNAPYNPVRLKYEIRTANIQNLISRLIIRSALWSEKYGTKIIVTTAMHSQ